MVWNAARSVLVSGCTCILKVGCATACSREALCIIMRPEHKSFDYDKGLIQIIIMINRIPDTMTQ